MFRSVFALFVLVFAAGWCASAAAAVEVGQKAPDFTLKDANGKDVSLAQYQGKIVVLEWTNPDCPFVQRHYKAQTMSQLAGKYAGNDVVWLAINSTSNASTAKMTEWSSRWSLSYPILLDNNGDVGKAYGAKTTPHMFIIGKNGTVAYEGGIDDDPSGDKAQKTNYVGKALDELLAGQAVSQSQTRSYGCSIKYAK